MATTPALRPAKYSVFLNGQWMTGRLTLAEATTAAAIYRRASASAVVVIENEREAREAKAAQMREINAKIDAEAAAQAAAKNA